MTDFRFGLFFVSKFYVKIIIKLIKNNCVYQSKKFLSLCGKQEKLKIMTEKVALRVTPGELFPNSLFQLSLFLGI